MDADRVFVEDETFAFTVQPSIGYVWCPNSIHPPEGWTFDDCRRYDEGTLHRVLHQKRYSSYDAAFRDNRKDHFYIATRANDKYAQWITVLRLSDFKDWSEDLDAALYECVSTNMGKSKPLNLIAMGTSIKPIYKGFRPLAVFKNKFATAKKGFALPDNSVIGDICAPVWYVWCVLWGLLIVAYLLVQCLGSNARAAFRKIF
jgi:hypothetical protein